MSNNRQRKRQPHDLEKLIFLWDNEKISIEQFCGQLVVWVQRLQVSTEFNERQLENLDREMADVVARVTTLEEGRSR